MWVSDRAPATSTRAVRAGALFDMARDLSLVSLTAGRRVKARLRISTSGQVACSAQGPCSWRFSADRQISAATRCATPRQTHGPRNRDARSRPPGPRVRDHAQCLRPGDGPQPPLRREERGLRHLPAAVTVATYWRRSACSAHPLSASDACQLSAPKPRIVLSLCSSLTDVPVPPGISLTIFDRKRSALRRQSGLRQRKADYGAVFRRASVLLLEF